MRRLREADLRLPKRRLRQFSTPGESMAINPIAFARTVNEQFLRYQLTAFPLADEALSR